MTNFMPHIETIHKTTMLVSVSVRNHMEDFHCAHLSDEQMKELNPIIRQGVLHGLLACNDLNRNAELNWLNLCVPIYWEKPIDTHGTKEYLVDGDEEE